MNAILKGKAVSQLFGSFYRKLGLTLTITFSVWFALSLGIFFFVRKKEVNDRIRVMTLFLYYPSRLFFVVWAPWMAILAQQDLDSNQDNLREVQTFDDINDCADGYAPYETGPIKD